jgi:membrane associated rhomboid family serine protease
VSQRRPNLAAHPARRGENPLVAGPRAAGGAASDTFRVDRSVTLTAPAATLLLAAIVLASAIGLFAAPSLIERNLFRPYWLVPRRQYATLVSSAFLHADLAHLFFNGFTFWAFAFPLERAMGTTGFGALYFFGLFASDLGTWFKHRRDPAYQTLGASGASGAILAVLFASIVYTPSASIFIFPIPIPIPAPLFAVAYLAYTYYASRHLRGRINHDAHLGGALAGLAFVALTDPTALARAVQGVTG